MWLKYVVGVLLLANQQLSAQETLTFLVASDCHHGTTYTGTPSDHVLRVNKECVEDMNRIAYQQLPGVSERTTTPRGVIFTGDLTENNENQEWSAFEDLWGLTGEKLLKYPLYEGYGNHDLSLKSTLVKDAIQARNNRRIGLTALSFDGVHYSWDWNGIHFIQLNLYPGGYGDPDNFNNTWNKPNHSLWFLQWDLATFVGDTNTPVMIFHHYGFDHFSMYAWGNGGWWSDQERENYYQQIKNYNIAGIFWGHSHQFAQKKWRGIDVYNVPATQYSNKSGSYFVVHVQNGQMTIGLRRCDQTWQRAFQKKISYAKAPTAKAITYHTPLKAPAPHIASISTEIQAPKLLTNPIKDQFTVHIFEPNTALELYTTEGKKLQTIAALPLGIHTINVRTLISGVYYVHWKNATAQGTLTVLKN